MAKTRIVFYQEADGDVPVLEWLDGLSEAAYIKCIARIELLQEYGHDLRRPCAAPLEDGIYELRAQRGRVNYRLLYFFHGKQAVVLAHGCTKERKVSRADIERARRRRERFRKNPESHTYREEV